MATGSHFGWQSSLPFRGSPYQSVYTSHKGEELCQPFWMSEINFRLHFSSFQMKTQLSFFFSKWPPAPKLIFVCISRLFSPFSFAFHYLRCMMNLPMRNGEHEVVPVKPNTLKKSKCFVTLGKDQLNVKI